MVDADFDDFERHRKLRLRLGYPVVDALVSNGVVGAPLTPDKRRTAEELLSWEPATPYLGDLPAVPRVRPEQFLSENLPSVLRRLGDVGEAWKHANETDARLASLAGRAYCALLASAAEESVAWTPLRLRGTEEHSKAVEALRSEPDVGSLWTDCRIATTFSRASSDWARMYDPIELLIYGAWRLCLLRGDWTLDTLLEAVAEQTDRVRAAAHGEHVEVPIFFGFGDIQVAGEVLDETAHVRPYIGSLQSRLLEEPDRLRLPDQHAGGLIVERKHPWKYCLLEDGGRGDNAARSPVHAFSTGGSFDDFRHWGACFAVAIAMSQLPDRLKPHHLSKRPQDSLTPTPTFRWVMNADPLYGATSLHLSYRWRADCPNVVVDAETLRRTAMLHSIVDRPTRIAIERLSAALDPSRGRSDCLIDAVIAWEALSGDCSRGGTALQVSAVMTHLVSDDNLRRQVRKEVSQLYAKRGRVVHGAAVVPEGAERDAANLVGLTALRRLVHDFPGLIGCDHRFELLCLDSH